MELLSFRSSALLLLVSSSRQDKLAILEKNGKVDDSIGNDGRCKHRGTVFCAPEQPSYIPVQGIDAVVWSVRARCGIDFSLRKRWSAPEEVVGRKRPGRRAWGGTVAW